MNKFIIKNPIISEKATQMSSFGKYVFLVMNSATKPEVKKALKEIYKVDVDRVQMINIPDKPRRFGQNIGVKPGYKKALVTLKTGQKLDILPHS